MNVDLARRTPTELEQQLIDLVGRGEALDLAGGEQVDVEALRSADESRTIRSWVMRNILRGLLVQQPDPRGLRIRGARIAGSLDLAQVTSEIRLVLDHCLLAEGVMARDARLAPITLTNCRIEHPTDAAFDADRLGTDQLDLRHTVVRAQSARGAVSLRGAHTAVCLCEGMDIENTSGPALDGTGLQVADILRLCSGFTARGSGDRGTVRLFNAEVGQVEFDGAKISNDSGPAFEAEGVRVERTALFRNGFSACGLGSQPTVRLKNARIGGTINFANGEITSDASTALDAEGAQVEQDFLLRAKFTISAATSGDAVCLLGARIGGSLDCASATVRNTEGPAIGASFVQIGQAALFMGGFRAHGAGTRSTVRLNSAHLGQVRFDGGRIDNRTGPALELEGAVVDGPALFREGFEARGSGSSVVVRLFSAHLGQLEFAGATIRNDSGPALNAHGMRVERSAMFDHGFVAAGSGGSPTIALSDVHIGDTLTFDPSRLTNRTKDQPTLAVRGLVYRGLPVGCSLETWLALLRDATPGYAPQPYQQLAAVHREAGHDGEARRILIAQQRDLHRRGDIGGRFARAVHSLWGVVGGYGYRAGRIAVALLIALVLAGALGWWAGHTVVGPGAHAAQHTASSARPGTPCSSLEQIGLGIDRGLPLGTTGVRTYCDLNTATSAGEWFTLWIWVLQAAVWALATLAVAGYTGLIRKIT